MDCPCGTERALEACCGPYIDGSQKPATAEALMRSRYTAYALKNADYVIATHDPETRDDLDPNDVRAWADQAEWHGLKVLRTERGGASDTDGLVEFVASYVDGKGRGQEHHELSTFRKDGDRWYFRDGELVEQKPFVRQGPKVGRNETCPCGSGKKHKKCCGRRATA